MSSDDSDDDHRNTTEQLQTWEQLLDRFSSEVHRLSREHVSSHRRLEANLKGQLVVMKRDLSRQITREVDDLRTSLSLAAQQSKFPLFRKLPVEVRVKIWELALFACPRILEIRASFLARGGQVVMARGVYHGVFSTPSLRSSYSTLGLGSLPPGSDGSNFAQGFRPVGPPGPPQRTGGAAPTMLGPHNHNHHTRHNHGGQSNNPLPGPVITTNRLPPPPLTSVCHESRTVALRYGNFYKTKAVEESLSPGHTSQQHRPGAPPPFYPQPNQTYLTAYTWFSPAIDYLKLPSTGPAYAATTQGMVGTGELFPPPLNIQCLTSQVLIRKPQDKPELERQVRRFQSSEIFPRLKTIGIIVTHDIVRPQSGEWEWGLGTSPSSQLFPTGEGPVRFVDLQSTSQTSLIPHLFPPLSPPNQVWQAHLSSLIKNDPSFTSPLLNSTTFRLEGWEVCWLVQRYKRFPLTFNLSQILDGEDLLFYDGEVTRHENGWVREELKRMPEVRLLHAFVLDEFSEGDAGYHGEKGVEMRRLYGEGGSGGFGPRLGVLGLV
ncbi:hypothetical protein QBC36DRAFT_20222 [Triangularia setosa]|uniref:2EXR domain-containing protein n=1 Tax=Triangularia setosa TaxID=2587417 RepID=A0AAN6W689_9PEZI|nr:hypothetical protein QBC36DRAFT_20222 [Podospora setosa]